MPKPVIPSRPRSGGLRRNHGHLPVVNIRACSAFVNSPSRCTPRTSMPAVVGVKLRRSPGRRAGVMPRFLTLRGGHLDDAKQLLASGGKFILPRRPGHGGLNFEASADTGANGPALSVLRRWAGV